MSLRIGVDIGGTFTDAVCMDEQTGQIIVAKVSSSTQDYSMGVSDSVDNMVSSMDDVGFLTHGTTVGINALLQGNLIKMGLITTKGFRDVLELGRGNRVEMYDPLYAMPKSLVPRFLRKEINERMDYTGRELTPLDEAEVTEVIRELKSYGVEGIAVCLLNSYANSTHEERIGELIRQEFPEALVSLSCEITREYREYERTSTAVINLGIMRDMSAYLTALEEKFDKKGYNHNLFIMQSNGGMMISELAKKIPACTLQSTLAGGIIGMETLSSMLGLPNLVGADMGGTSLDVEMVIEGSAKTRSSFKVKTPTSGADGYPVMSPTLDVSSIGAGGGSIAWIDQGGSLHVGPQSAGAAPGPACYLRGGTEATVTDANVVLGRLNQEYLLGGKMRIDKQLSFQAVGKLAERYGMSKEEMANGILEIVTSNMAGAIRTMVLERGLDPRDFTLVGFGGAGPLHVAQIAEHLEIKHALIPGLPGTFSAWGMLMAPVKHDYVQTMVASLATVELSQLQNRLETLRDKGIQQLLDEGIPTEAISVTYKLDVRYIGQEHTIPVELEDCTMTEASRQMICDLFDAEHQRTYLHSAPYEPKELAALRVTVYGSVNEAILPEIAKGSEMPDADARIGSRKVYLDKNTGFVDAPIYNRPALLAGNKITGPALIEETTSSVYLPPQWTMTMDRYGNMMLNMEEEAVNE